MLRNAGISLKVEEDECGDCANSRSQRCGRYDPAINLYLFS
jgi:hypothetical protein